MRKLIAIIAIMLIGMVSYGQEAGTYDKKLDYTVSWAKYDGTTADVITTTDTLWSYTYFKNSYKPFDIVGADNTLLASIKELFAKFWE